MIVVKYVWLRRSFVTAGSSGLGHVRYPTAGTLSAQEAQPFFVNSPLGMYLIHNGNLTNAAELRNLLQGPQSFFNRHLRTGSDSEVSPSSSSALWGDRFHESHHSHTASPPGVLNDLRTGMMARTVTSQCDLNCSACSVSKIPCLPYASCKCGSLCAKPRGCGSLRE